MQRLVGISQGQEGRIAPAPASCLLPPAPELAHCPLCDHDLPFSEFGVCRARESGRNLYCKACIRAKVNESRAALREWKARKKLLADQGTLPLIGLAPDPKGKTLHGSQIEDPFQLHHERVFAAIRQGARTQKEIFDAIKPCNWKSTPRRFSGKTGTEMDRIGESIALLLLGQPRRIQVEVVNRQRVYTLYSPAEGAGGSPFSYSTVSGVLHPVVGGHRSSVNPRPRWGAA